VVWKVLLRLAVTLLLSHALAGATALTYATVLHSREEALALAFPHAEHIEHKTFSLSAEEVQRAARLATTPIETKQVTIQVGYNGDQVLGYAFLDNRPVRTLPGTFLIVLSPAGVVQKVMVLAFHEPEEYLPAERWLRQFEQKPLSPALQLQHDIRGIAGATLSSQAVTGAVRQALALFQVLIQERH
jgi:hypothetical protein